MSAWNRLTRFWDMPQVNKRARRAKLMPRHVPRLEALEDRCVPANVTYHGGYILTNVQVQAIFLGSDWVNSSALQQDAQNLTQYLQYIVNSPYMDMLGEYYDVVPPIGNVYVGRGSYAGADFASGYSLPYLNQGLAINDDLSNPNNAFANPSSGYLIQEIENGRVVQPNPWSTLYIVFLPPGVGSYQCEVGTSSEPGPWQGYHFAFDVTLANNNATRINYAVIPYPGSGNSTLQGLSDFEEQTEVTSHELAEGVTDPYQYLDNYSGANIAGWYDSTSGGEIGDLAEGYWLRLNGYVVQAEWSAASNQVVGPIGATWLQEPTGGGGSGGQGEGGGEGQGPIANPDSYRVGGVFAFVPAPSGVLANDTDVFGNPLQAVLVSGPSHGQLTLGADGSFSYSPNPGFSGIDTFTYSASDGSVSSPPATVTLNVNPPVYAADFPGQGISRYVNGAGWQSILPFDAQQVVVDGGGFVYARFGPSGIWYTPSDQNHWQKLDQRNASWIGVDGNEDLLADFAGSGLYWFVIGSGTPPHRLTPADASLISLDKNGAFAAEFPGFGVWLCKPGLLPSNPWQQLLLNGKPVDASWVGIDKNSEVLADFPGQGLWRYTAGQGWQPLTGADPVKISLAENGDFVASFWNGVWRYEQQSGWDQILPLYVEASQLAIDANDNVAAEFLDHGLWHYSDAVGWQQLSTNDAAWVGMDIRGDVLADFQGIGLSLFDDNGQHALYSADPSSISLD
jgi:hypothetical protein